MEHAETRMLDSLPFQVKVYCRYVDDTFVILKSATMEAFHEALNSVHHASAFTCETEKDNVLVFFDVLLRRTDKSRVETDSVSEAMLHRKFFVLCISSPDRTQTVRRGDVLVTL